MLNDHGDAQVREEEAVAQDEQVSAKRHSLLALMALVATAGCSSGSSSSVRDTNPGYYGHSYYRRSPYGRRRGYGRR
jgi:hypothetical protein